MLKLLWKRNDCFKNYYDSEYICLLHRPYEFVLELLSALMLAVVRSAGQVICGAKVHAGNQSDKESVHD
jgi:hypothetical protein